MSVKCFTSCTYRILLRIVGAAMGDFLFLVSNFLVPYLFTGRSYFLRVVSCFSFLVPIPTRDPDEGGATMGDFLCVCVCFFISYCSLFLRPSLRPSFRESFWKRGRKYIRNSVFYGLSRVYYNRSRTELGSLFSECLRSYWWEVSRPVLLFSRVIVRTFTAFPLSGNFFCGCFIRKWGLIFRIHRVRNWFLGNRNVSTFFF